MAHIYTCEDKEKMFYEDFRNLKLHNRYKFDDTFQVKTEVIDWDRDICIRIYKGGFTIDNDIRIEFKLYSNGGIIVPDIETITDNEEQHEVFEMAIRELHYRFVRGYEPELLELKHKYIDGKVTYFLSEFIDIDKKFDTKKIVSDEYSSLTTKVFYKHDNGYEEDISRLFRLACLNYVVEEEVQSFRDFLSMNAFFMMCRIFNNIDGEKYGTDDEDELEYCKENIKLEYDRFRFEVYVYGLKLKK